MGIEPTYPAWKAGALPLSYTRKEEIGAVDEARTRDLHLGKVALYQLSYYRIFIFGAGEETRTHTPFDAGT